MKQLFVLFFVAIAPWAAVAATCEPGYYLENGECQLCNTKPFYCPGDDTRHPCPTTDTDYEKLTGWTLLFGKEATWANKGAKSATSCHSQLFFQDSQGNRFLAECPFNGENYLCNPRHWYVAGAGYYLADYFFTSNYPWYYGVKPCTNAPANAHYTGPGTPDAPDGSVIDANDCPWACDAGYGKSASDECLPLCSGGVTVIRANSVSVPLFNEKHTSPTLAVEYAGQVCYADLVPGLARPAINIDYNGQVYHTVNQ